jgi:hypothetical protein
MLQRRGEERKHAFTIMKRVYIESQTRSGCFNHSWVDQISYPPIVAILKSTRNGGRYGRTADQDCHNSGLTSSLILLDGTHGG